SATTREGTALRRTTSPPPASSEQPRDAKAIEPAVRAVDGLQPVEVGREVGDQGLDVDAVRGGAVVLERDQRLREEVDGTARGAPPGAQVERGAERSSSKSPAGGGAASFASNSSTSRLERPRDARSAAATRASRRASRSRPRTSINRRSAASSPRERCAPPCS